MFSREDQQHAGVPDLLAKDRMTRMHMYEQTHETWIDGLPRITILFFVFSKLDEAAV